MIGKRDVAISDGPITYLHASFPEDRRVVLVQCVFVHDLLEDNNYELYFN